MDRTCANQMRLDENVDIILNQTRMRNVGSERGVHEIEKATATKEF